MSDGTNSELLLLSLEDVYRMQREFLEAYETMIEEAYKQLITCLNIKLDSIREC